MDDPSTLRRKAARHFENAASSATIQEAEKLNEVGRQLELWADDLEEVYAAHEREASSPGMRTTGEQIRNRTRGSGAGTRS